MLIANATGCSSIYGGNLPTTPWATNATGRGPAWSNSLFEDNAEFGLGMRLALDKQRPSAELLTQRAAGPSSATTWPGAARKPTRRRGRDRAQRERVAELRAGWPRGPSARPAPLSRRRRPGPPSVWIVGGDGWAYDIGFGGLDHVLASGRDVNILVLDTEVYSNTGGQASKATPRGAVAKFAAAGKATPRRTWA
jgi:pyruvate-ferredoxin/flavodoxin oxidoreductase